MAETVDIWDWTGTDVKVLRCRVELTGVSVVTAQQAENAIEPITATVEVEVPLIVVKDKGFIYRGIYVTEGMAWHFFPQSTEGFTQQGDYYVKHFDYRISDPTKTAYRIDDVVYNYSHYEAKQGGVYFYYENNGNEVFAAQGQMGGNIGLNIPVGMGIPQSLYYGESQHTVFDNPLMINAKAPYGSLETDAVWTVSTSTLSPIGEVISTTIAENQIWSNYNN